MDYEPTMKKAYSLVKAVDANQKRDLERSLNKIWDKVCETNFPWGREKNERILICFTQMYTQ